MNRIILSAGVACLLVAAMVSNATAMTIFVAKLNYTTSEEAVRTAFEQYGKVDSVKIILDKDTGRSKGFGFVDMPDEKQAWAAINALNGTQLDGRALIVKRAKQRGEDARRGGARGHGGRGAKPPARGGGYGARGAKPPTRGGGYGRRGAKPPARGAKPPAKGAKPPAKGTKPPAKGAKKK